ncbi:hypothetical protein pb186bvf_012387 [Paramecium bursaria]
MQSYKEAQQLFQKNSLNLPMTEHEIKLNLMLDFLKSELDKDQKELQILRQEIIHYNYSDAQQSEEISQGFIEDLADFTIGFRKLAEEDINETNDLSRQVENIKNDKIRIKKTAAVLDHKVAEMERVLGVGLKDAIDH